jgi:hypothetical protein
LLLAGVNDGAASETGLKPGAAVAPEELSIGDTEAPRHAPITPAAY